MLHLPFSVLPLFHFLCFLTFLFFSVQFPSSCPPVFLSNSLSPPTLQFVLPPSSSGLHYFPVVVPLFVSSVNPSDHSTLVFCSLSPEMAGVLLWTVEQAFALWGFCLLCEVFSQIAAFHSSARHITPLCVLAYVSVFGNALMLLRPVNLSTVCAHF